MNRCLRTAALLSALMLICTACTDGSWLDGTRLSFNTRGIDSVLATEDRANSSLPEMVSRDQEVLAVLEVDTPAVDGARAAYSADNGTSWQPVLFGGKADPGMDLVSVAAVREDQWLLVGHRNRQAFSYTSRDGKEFTLQPAPIFDTTGTTLNAAVGTGHGWLIATSPQRQDNGAAVTLHRSTDGSTGSATEGTAAGLPAAPGAASIRSAWLEARRPCCWWASRTTPTVRGLPGPTLPATEAAAGRTSARMPGESARGTTASGRPPGQAVSSG